MGSLRRYDVQATYGMTLALLSVLPALCALGLALRNYQHELGQIVYGEKSMFLPAFLVCVGVSAIPASLGFLFGLSSSGQRRNDKQARSWVGFFLGGSVLTLNTILLIAFWMLRLEHAA